MTYLPVKVPAIAYGGPDVPADQPSHSSHKIAESGIIIEFIADLSKDIQLLPKDPVQRAKARFFIQTIAHKLFEGYFTPIKSGTDPAALLEAIEVLQNLLPSEGYAVGEWSIADAAVAPFLARAEVAFSHDLGTYEAGKGKAVWVKLEQDPQYERFRKYLTEVKGRKSFQNKLEKEHMKNEYIKFFSRTSTGDDIQSV